MQNNNLVYLESIMNKAERIESRHSHVTGLRIIFVCRTNVNRIGNQTLVNPYNIKVCKAFLILHID